MVEIEIFNSVTEKIYNNTIEIAERNKLICSPKNYCIKILKSEFTDDEWKFIVENEMNFKYSYTCNKIGNLITLNVYKVCGDALFTNSIIVTNIRNNFVERH